MKANHESDRDLLDNSPRCRECGVKLEGRDVYEGICKDCREELILSGKRPSSRPAKAAPTAGDTPPPVPVQVSMEEDTKEMDAVAPAPAKEALAPADDAPAPAEDTAEPSPDEPAGEELRIASSEPQREPEAAPAPETTEEAEAEGEKASPLLSEDEEDVDLESLVIGFGDSEAEAGREAPPESELEAEAPTPAPAASAEPPEEAEAKTTAQEVDEYVAAVLAPEEPQEEEPAAEEPEEGVEPSTPAPQEADTDAVEVTAKEEEDFLRLRLDTDREEEGSAPEAGQAAEESASAFAQAAPSGTGGSERRAARELQSELESLRLRMEGLSSRLEAAERSSRGGRGPVGAGFRFAIGLVLGLGVLALLVGGGMYAVGKLMHPPTLELLQRVLNSIGAG